VGSSKKQNMFQSGPLKKRRNQRNICKIREVTDMAGGAGRERRARPQREENFQRKVWFDLRTRVRVFFWKEKGEVGRVVPCSCLQRGLGQDHNATVRK